MLPSKGRSEVSKGSPAYQDPEVLLLLAGLAFTSLWRRAAAKGKEESSTLGAGLLLVLAALALPLGCVYDRHPTGHHAVRHRGRRRNRTWVTAKNVRNSWRHAWRGRRHHGESSVVMAVPYFG